MGGVVYNRIIYKTGYGVAFAQHIGGWMKLYSYFRSSAAYRVRIALNLKGVAYETVPVHLVKGEHHTDSYLSINPQGRVPLLEDQGQYLTQSLAMIEYLEEIHPEIALLPRKPVDRAYVRSLALIVACDIHPVNNLGVLTYLQKMCGVSAELKDAWYRHWVESGLASIESMLAKDARTGRFCYGDTPTMADCVLVPQLFNARRFNCDLSAMPTILRIDAECATLPAFIDAAPANQPDAE